MKDIPSATVIGDVVGSRTAADRPALHRGLTAALDEANARFSPARPFRVTVGDEYQGCFDALGPALAASLHLRLALVPDVDVRHGLGWGPVQQLDGEVEDGPGWWAAREAIEAVKREAGAATRSRRTAYVVHRGDWVPGPDPAAVNAALLLRDELLARADERAMSVLRGLLDGMTQNAIATALGVSPSAVSQRVRGDSLGAIVSAQRLLEEVA